MHVYIIDDDELSVFLTQNILMLEDASYKISTFESAEEALVTLQKSHPDAFPELILLDLNMPGMNGWDFLDELVLLEPGLTRTCKIYIITSSLDPSDLNKSKTYGHVTGFINKPVTSEDIKAIQI